MKKFFTVFVLILLLCPAVPAICGEKEWKGYFRPTSVQQEHEYWCVHACNVMLGKYRTQKESFVAYLLMNTPAATQAEVLRRINDEPGFLEHQIQQVRGVREKDIFTFTGYRKRETLSRIFTEYTDGIPLPMLGTVPSSFMLNGANPGFWSLPDENVGHAFVIYSVLYYYGDVIRPDKYIVSYIDPADGLKYDINLSTNTSGFEGYYY